MATALTSAFELKSMSYGGLIHEDVLNELFNIDPIDLPFMDMCGRESSKHPYKSWVQEGLAAPSLANKRVEGAAAGAPPPYPASPPLESRIGNHHQISDKVVVVTDRASASDGIGYGDRLAHEMMIKQKELKRDMEAILLSPQGSVEMVTTTGSTVAGETAGAPSMIADANSDGATTGAFTSGIFADVASYSASRGLTETLIRNIDETVYTAGGEPSILMSTPRMIRGISEYLFSASARIATLMSDAKSTEGKYGKQGATAIGAVKIFTSDYSTLELIPNRIQQTYINSVANVDVFLFDPQYWSISYLQGIEANTLARDGTAEKRQLSVDYTLMCLSQKASGVICAINPTTAVVA